MEKLKRELDELNESIRELENEIENARIEAECNIGPLTIELEQIREDKRKFASKNDFDSIQSCRRREKNLKFKINAQWNHYSILKNDLVKLKNEKSELEERIQLKKDRLKRKEEILSRMNLVLDNYRKSQNLKQAAIDSKIDPDHVEQWLEWGKNDFNDTYTYFHSKILEIDDHFRQLEAQRLKSQMDSVLEAYEKTGSLKEASAIADVSYDTVQYWNEWGSRGFGAENTYFHKRIKEIKHDM